MMKECKDWRGGRAGLEVRRKGMSKVKKEKAEGNRKKEAKKYKNKCRRLCVGAALFRRLSRRPLPAWERNILRGWFFIMA